jgi:cytochrome P450
MYIILALTVVIAWTVINCFSLLKVTKTSGSFRRPPKVAYSLPYIGHLYRLFYRPHKTLLHWSDTYSKAYEIDLGRQSVYVLNGTSLIRSAFIKNSQCLANRPELYMLNKTLKGLGLLSARNDRPYIEHRSFTVGCLNDCLRLTSQDYLMTKLATCFARLKNSENIYLYDLKEEVSLVVAQNLLNFLFNVDDSDQTQLKIIVKLIDQNFRSTAIVSVYNYLPITRLFQTSIFHNANRVSEFLKRLLDEKLANHDEDQSLVSKYMKLIGDRRTFNTDELFVLLQDLFLSGTETLTNTIVWALFYAAYYPSHQETIRSEIANNCINADSRQSMPFVEAFLNETMRHQCSGPILVPREFLFHLKNIQASRLSFFDFKLKAK